MTKSYDIRSCKTKTLAVRILQGYEITKKKCTHCGVPLMKYRDETSCVICPKVVDSTGISEDGGVEIINNLLSGSTLGSGSVSGSESSPTQHDEEQSEDVMDSSNRNSINNVTTSYSIESEDDNNYAPSIEDDIRQYLEHHKVNETIVEEEPSSPSVTETPSESEAQTGEEEDDDDEEEDDHEEDNDDEEEEEIPIKLPIKEEKKDNAKNLLFMKKIGEMTKLANKQKEEKKSANTKHISFTKELAIPTSPTQSKMNTPMRACASPKTATKRMSINNITGDESAKKCYMPAWESKMNSVDKEYLESQIQMMAGDNIPPEVVQRNEKRDAESRDDVFFSELRQKAASKANNDPFLKHQHADDEVDLPHIKPVPSAVSAMEDIVEKEFKLQQQRWKNAGMRKMEEKKMEESMSCPRKNTQTVSDIPVDEMKGWAIKCIKEDKAPEPFDEYKPQSEVETRVEIDSEVVTDTMDSPVECEEYVLANTEELLKSTKEVLGETKLHLSNQKKQAQKESKEESNSSESSLSESVKEHTKRITALEAKTLRKYSNAALMTTNPNPSSASLKSITTAEKDQRMMLRRRVVELEAEALRKHSEAALAALHARQALDKMLQNREKNKRDKATKEEKQPKTDDLSMNSSLSTKESRESTKYDEPAEETVQPTFSVESASISQYSESSEHRRSIDDGRGEPEDAHTPRERHPRSIARDTNPPALKERSRAHSSEYHREESGHRPPARSRSLQRSTMPPNILLPALHSPESKPSERVHHASPRQSRDKPSRPHLSPYPPRTPPASRKSSRQQSQPTERPFSPRTYIRPPSPSIQQMNPAPVPYKHHGSMTPRTVHEQQRFDYGDNQLSSRNFESMMLASNQTVQERMMNNQQQPMVDFNGNMDFNSRVYYDTQQQMMNRHHQERLEMERMSQQQQPRVNYSGNYMPQEEMTRQQQRPRSDFSRATHFDPATQGSHHLHSPKVRFTTPCETPFGGETSHQFVHPNDYNQQYIDSRNDGPSMRYDGRSMRW